MLYEILSKLVAESLLSLYPVFVKNIPLSIDLQMWSRFFSYIVISFWFIDFKYIFDTLFTKNGILLWIITIIHVYTSYRGFQLLESGISYSIFYLYPIMILLMAGKTVHPIMILSIIGVYLLSIHEEPVKENLEDKLDTEKEKTKEKPFINAELFDYEGIVMILLAALTEAYIYFIVRNIKTTNHWNHVFLSYFPGALLFTGYLFNSIKNIQLNSVLTGSLGINAVIGLMGYLLRFYAMSNLDTTIYAVLSYFGIFMAYVYGVVFSGDIITWPKIIGTICIILPNLFLKFTKK